MDDETRTAIYVLAGGFGVLFLAWLFQNGRAGLARLVAASVSVAFLVVVGIIILRLL